MVLVGVCVGGRGGSRVWSLWVPTAIIYNNNCIYSQIFIDVTCFRYSHQESHFHYVTELVFLHTKHTLVCFFILFFIQTWIQLGFCKFSSLELWVFTMSKLFMWTETSKKIQYYCVIVEPPVWISSILLLLDFNFMAE